MRYTTMDNARGVDVLDSLEDRADKICCIAVPFGYESLQ